MTGGVWRPQRYNLYGSCLGLKPHPWASDSKETLLKAINFQRIMAERKIVDSHFHIFDLEARNSFPNQNPSHGFPSDQQPEINRSFTNYLSKKPVNTVH